MVEKSIIRKYMNAESSNWEVIAYYDTDPSRYNMTTTHTHPWLEVMYLLEGSASIYIMDQVYELKPGMFMVIDVNTKHMMTAETKIHSRMISMEIDCSISSNPYVDEDLDMVTPYILLKDNCDLFKTLKSIIKLMASDSSSLNSHVKRSDQALLDLYINELFLIIERQWIINQTSQTDTEWIDQVTTYIEDHYDEQLNTDYLASLVHVHPSYLYRVFKDQTGMTMNQYITKARVEQSKYLLEKTQAYMIDIAVAVGYNSSQYFSYVFKRVTGYTPKAYRSDHTK